MYFNDNHNVARNYITKFSIKAKGESILYQTLQELLLSEYHTKGIYCDSNRLSTDNFKISVSVFKLN